MFEAAMLAQNAAAERWAQRMLDEEAEKAKTAPAGRNAKHGLQ